MIKLNISPVVKEITMPNGKVVKIPKLGLKHYHMFKQLDKKLNESLVSFLDGIHPGMTAAEAEYVMVHVLAFNNKIQEKQTFGDFVVDINNMYFVTETEFELGGITYYFKEPSINDMFVDKLDILQKQFIRNDADSEVDFEELPAFVLGWADRITATVAIDTPDCKIYGGLNIIGKV